MAYTDNIIKDNNIFLILSILIILLIIFYIYPNIIKEINNDVFYIDDQVNNLIQDTDQFNNLIQNTDQVENYNDISSNISSNKNKRKVFDDYKIDTNICSKQCCKFTQWPIPFNTKNPIINNETLNNFIPSNLSCNRGENGGCVCLTKDNFDYLSNHGN